LVLTGLPAPRIAQGKFLAALAYVGQYLVMVAPIGAVPFIAGGVTAAEVMLAYLFLTAFATLAVGFGVSVGSAIRKAAPAMLVSITVATAASFVAFIVLGSGAAALAHEAWPGITSGAPVWLPTAYVQADLGWDSAVTLFYTPWALALILSWFFYEVAVANMSAPGTNRYYGLKRWTLVAYPILLSIAYVPRLWQSYRSDLWITPAIAMAWVLFFGLLLILLFCGESPRLSRRVSAELAREDLPSLRRWLSPKLGRGHALVLLLSLVALLITHGIGTAQELDNATQLGTDRSSYITALGMLAVTVFGFLTFAAGFNLFVRVRATSALPARLLTVVVCLVVLVGPWLVLAIAGLLAGGVDSSLWVAAPSPLFWLVLADEATSKAGIDSATLWLQVGSSVMWLCVGIACGALALSRAAAARGDA
jgi:hypothetical protein